MRILNILVIAALVIAATYVYKIKFDSTLQAERVAKLRNELRRERDAVASLRAEWARLEAPTRIQGLAERHLKLKAVLPAQFDSLDNLPMRPAPVSPQQDPIASVIAPSPEATGSIGKPKVTR